MLELLEIISLDLVVTHLDCHRKYLCTKTTDNQIIYETSRNQVTTIIRNAKRSLFHWWSAQRQNSFGKILKSVLALAKPRHFSQHGFVLNINVFFSSTNMLKNNFTDSVSKIVARCPTNTILLILYLASYLSVYLASP